MNATPKKDLYAQLTDSIIVMPGSRHDQEIDAPAYRSDLTEI
jgi:hypothetical protein